jgi:hypothetical protein
MIKIGRSAPAHDGVFARYRPQRRWLRDVRANLHKKPIESDSDRPEDAPNVSIGGAILSEVLNLYSL